ncbi:MAG: presenilin family intramembrane aspartyl protease [Candidatus Nanoarchaeia archaeon]|nr:presenilin family intramembrane aspartyl protease [Candidatus Nanoarchaeia archaeon]
MKHNWKITLILILLFLAAQFVGLVVTKHFIQEELPYNMERPEVSSTYSAAEVLIMLVLASIFIFILAKFKAYRIWRFWFFISILITLSISFSAFVPEIFALGLALIFTLLRTFKNNVYIHNFTEIFIYGSLAAIFSPMLNIWGALIILLIISIYDMIAVWKTKHMIELAKFQTKTKMFAGLFIPYKKDNAILGGGDIGFPLLFTGVAMGMYGNFAFIIPIFTAIALTILLMLAKRKKFYPAMPFLTAGCLTGYLVMVLVF